MSELKKLKDKFILAASKHGDATNSGDYKLGNKQVDIIDSSYKELVKTIEGRESLRDLMSNPNLSVKLWAASVCLPFFTIEAEKVLSNVSKDASLIGSSAEITLREWKKGNLKFD